MTDTQRALDDRRIRSAFPLFEDPSIVYLDNAATTQKPDCVLRAVREYYEHENANPLRGLYELSLKATEEYENARKAAADFIHASSANEIIFTRNATESLNLVAFTWADANLKPGDEILISILEHHSNILPWQMAAKRTGAVLRYVECNEKGVLTPEMVRAAMTEKTKLVAMTQISNVLGVKNDIKEFARIAHEFGAVFVCDGAQSVPHIPVDVQDLDVDFLAFSGHKMMAPMGIGVLYGKLDLLEKMPPFLTGGEMIEYVKRQSATFAEVPHKFEAGTVNAGGAVGLRAAIDYYNTLGFDFIEERENHLTELCMDQLREIPHLHILGDDDSMNHHGIVSFIIDGVHPHDIAAILDADHIDIRVGHHCAQPLHKYLGHLSSARASLCFYNTEDDIFRLAESLKKVRGKMGYAE
jgi:cysteine desulfurase/selenocysteine lyase